MTKYWLVPHGNEDRQKSLHQFRRRGGRFCLATPPIKVAVRPTARTHRPEFLDAGAGGEENKRVFDEQAGGLLIRHGHERDLNW